MKRKIEGKWTDIYLKSEEEIQKLSLIQKDDYFLWLDNFTKTTSSFTENDTKKFENIDKENCYNIKNIRYLFLLIHDYEEEVKFINLIKTDDDMFIKYYFIFNNAKYEIGIIRNKYKFITCCHRLPDDYNANFIHIEDIKKYYNKDKSCNKFQQLKNEVNKLLNNNITAEEILESVNEEINHPKVKKIGV